MRVTGMAMLAAALVLAIGVSPLPVRARQAATASGTPSGDMASGSGGARPDAPAQGGVRSAPGASAGTPAPPHDKSAPAGTSAGEGAHAAGAPAQR